MANLRKGMKSLNNKEEDKTIDAQIIIKGDFKKRSIIRGKVTAYGGDRVEVLSSMVCVVGDDKMIVKRVKNRTGLKIVSKIIIEDAQFGGMINREIVL